MRKKHLSEIHQFLQFLVSHLKIQLSSFNLKLHEYNLIFVNVNVESWDNLSWVIRSRNFCVSIRLYPCRSTWKSPEECLSDVSNGSISVWWDLGWFLGVTKIFSDITWIFQEYLLGFSLFHSSNKSLLRLFNFSFPRCVDGNTFLWELYPGITIWINSCVVLMTSNVGGEVV